MFTDDWRYENVRYVKWVDSRNTENMLHAYIIVVALEDYRMIHFNCVHLRYHEYHETEYFM